MWDDCEGIGRLRDGREVLRTKEGTRHAQERRTAFNGAATQRSRLHFGLGAVDEVESVKVRWPSGIVQELADVAANQVLTLHETDE